MSTSSCSSCGATGNSGAFCTTCGTPVAASQTPAGSGPSKRTTALRWTAAGLASLIVAGGAAWWALAASEGQEEHAVPGAVSPTRSPSKTKVRPVTLDRGSTVLSEPQRSWSVTPSDFDAESFGGFDDVGTSPVMALDDQVIIRPDDAYVALDAETGKERWSYRPDSSDWSFCSVLTSVLVCRGEKEIQLVDGHSGSVRATKPSPEWFGAFHETQRGILWVYGAPDSPTVELLSGKDFTTLWQVQLQDPNPASEPFESEIYSAFRINGDLATIEFGRSSWDVALQSGRQLEAYEDSYLERQYLTRRGQVVVDTSYDSETERSFTVVRDLDGSPLVSGTGSAWYDNGSAPRGLIGIGGALYDVSTGAQIWDHSATYGESAQWLTNGRFVELRTDDTFAYLQSRSGQHVVSVSNVAARSATRDAILTIDEYGELAVHGVDGTMAWRRDVPAPEYSSQQVAIAHNTVLAATDSTITAFTGFTAHKNDGSAGSEEEAETDYWTDCGSEPVFTPREVTSANGGVQVEYEVTATCPGGQWINWADYRVTWQNGDGDTWATGSFDFSYDPPWIPEEGRRLRLVYPFEGTNGDLTDMQEAAQGAASQEGDAADKPSSSQHVLCTPEDSAGRGEVPAIPDAIDEDETLPVAGTSVLDPTTGEPIGEGLTEDSALAALKRIAAADAPTLDADAEGQWLPQLSSKLYGTVDDGISYTYRDILSEHLRLRARYPEVRLAFSGEWGSFTGKDFWVTLSLTPSAKAEPALKFCSDNAFIPGDCYAKRLVRNGTPEGNTRHVVE